MIDLIQQRLETYQSANAQQEEQAIREIMQEIALYGLWQSGFFEVAAFQGGTSLRILHQLPRFSEDLDFILKQANDDFRWDCYLKKLLDCFELFGLKPEVLDKSRMDQVIRKAILKDDSISQQLNLAFYQSQNLRQPKKLMVKLEIDINPPANSGFTYSYLDFPLDHEVCHQDLSSNFSLKIHALLCRPYLKGRDWYDFNWYIKQAIKPNMTHLAAALQQSGPWQDQELVVNQDWLKLALGNKIISIDWEKAKQDIERFLPMHELPSLKLWSKRFFQQKLMQLVKDN